MSVGERYGATPIIHQLVRVSTSGEICIFEFVLGRAPMHFVRC